MTPSRTWRWTIARLLLPIVLPFVLTCIVFAQAGSVTRVITGTVVRVYDADTPTLRNKRERERVRLHGVDAPEIAQPYGIQARDLARGLIVGKQARALWRYRDQNGRPVARVRVVIGERTIDLGEALLRDGLAWYAPQYAKGLPPSVRERYARLEREARERRIGLWADDAPISPWQFRKTRR